MARHEIYYDALNIANATVILLPPFLRSLDQGRPEMAACVAFFYVNVVGIILNTRLAFRPSAAPHARLAVGFHTVGLLVAAPFMASTWRGVVGLWVAFVATTAGLLAVERLRLV